MDAGPGSPGQGNRVDTVALFINARARKGTKLQQVIIDGLQRRGIIMATSLVSENPFDLVEAIKRAIDSGQRYIIVGGGDGTLGLVVDSFVRRDVVLGILPLGTQNAFAGSLGIPRDMEAALDVISAGHHIHLDLGTVDGNCFITVTSLGISSLAVLLMTQQVKSYLGLFAYAWEGLRVLWRYPAFNCTVTDGSRIWQHKTHEMMVANRHFLRVLPEEMRPKKDDGGLIVLPLDASRWTIITGWLAMVLQIKWGLPRIQSYTARECTIEAEPIMPVSLDGDVLDMTPVRIAVVPKAVRVLVPAEYPHIGEKK